MDKVTETLLAALKQALAEPAEQRLFRSGKLPGLFPGRIGSSAEAAARALRDGLLEVVRSETKGKTILEWVKLTPRGLDFLHDHESPVQVLRELRTVLQTNRENVPVWLVEMRQEMQKLGTELTAKMQQYLQRLDALSLRVEEALRRADALGPNLPDGLTTAFPWVVDALTYLDKRRAGGAKGECALPELFAAVRDKHAELSIGAFHDGLRRLHDRGALRLLPAAEPAQPLAEPEHALLDGDAVLYFAAR